MINLRQKQIFEQLNKYDIDVALITDEDSVYYYCGYYDYLHMDFGRPTILALTAGGKSILITPMMELDMAQAAANVDHVEPWNDGMGDEWRGGLDKIIANNKNIAIEMELIPAVVNRYLCQTIKQNKLKDITPVISLMRMIKSAQELKIARHAGEVAMAMMAAAKATIGENVAEYDVAIATSQAGTRKAAEILEQHYEEPGMSPNTHFLQIMASGEDIVMPHHRASIKRIKYGDPVFMCFCGMTNFHRFKLGFDRTFWVGEITKPSQKRVYEVAVESQDAALEKLGPGITAEYVHEQYAKVIQKAGYEYPFRCGRATGFSFLEKPQLVSGDKTILQAGMVFAVDGSVTDSKNSFRAQVGDSYIITKTGYEPITHFSKAIEDVVL